MAPDDDATHWSVASATETAGKPSALDELAARMAGQHKRLTGPPIPVDFTYDRNGLRLGIAALEDELRELYDEWAANKKRLGEPGVAARFHHELLDVAAVAMLILRNIPAPLLQCPQCISPAVAAETGIAVLPQRRPRAT